MSERLESLKIEKKYMINYFWNFTEKLVIDVYFYHKKFEVKILV